MRSPTAFTLAGSLISCHGLFARLNQLKPRPGGEFGRRAQAAEAADPIASANAMLARHDASPGGRDHRSRCERATQSVAAPDQDRPRG
jgi:hypothetical protein